MVFSRTFKRASNKKKEEAILGVPIAMRRKRKTIAFLISLMILVYVFFNHVHFEYANESMKPHEVAYDNLKLANSPKDVPIFIVDQHQEVIPYWYKAMKEGLIADKRNTIIHIDAHNDMASPYYTKRFKNFDPKLAKRESHFLPMMQSNDVFIYSAIIKGLVDRVIWIKPSWLKNQETYYRKGYVGLTRVKGFRNEFICFCEQHIVNGHPEDGLECVYEDPTRSRNTSALQLKDCHQIYKYKFIEVSESKFLEDIQFMKSISLFVDIDEDFFGVESGTVHLLKHGISNKTQNFVDTILPRLYNPTSRENEMELNTKLKQAFNEMVDLLHLSNYRSLPVLRLKVRNIIETNTGAFFNDPALVHEFVAFLLTLPVDEIVSLSKEHYCSLSSFRFPRRTDFSLCHGSMYPTDTHLTEFYVGSDKEIVTRGDSISSILRHILRSTKPKFYTIARSQRDGYVPRAQQRGIERIILRSIIHSERLNNRNGKILYDPFLSFGKKGWID